MSKIQQEMLTTSYHSKNKDKRVEIRAGKAVNQTGGRPEAIAVWILGGAWFYISNTGSNEPA